MNANDLTNLIGQRVNACECRKAIAQHRAERVRIAKAVAQVGNVVSIKQLKERRMNGRR